MKPRFICNLVIEFNRPRTLGQVKELMRDLQTFLMGLKDVTEVDVSDTSELEEL